MTLPGARSEQIKSIRKRRPEKLRAALFFVWFPFIPR